MIEDRIAKVLKEKFQEDDLKDCFLVDVEHLKGNKVIVYVEDDTQLTIDKCRRISRFLEHKIEENNWMPEKYTLDVSSPGLDNPLRLLRQYKKNIGRKVNALLSNNERVEGEIISVDGNTIVLRIGDKEDSIDFKEINEAKILVSFK